jgi:DnaK suppressor protein
MVGDVHRRRLCRDGPATGYEFAGMTDTTYQRARLTIERSRVVTQVEQLQGLYDSIVDASRDVAADDEHDPDGATVGFERAQVGALLERARQRIEELDDALERVDDGAYGTCDHCGEAIAPERLAAMPTARTCVDCTSSNGR